MQTGDVYIIHDGAGARPRGGPDNEAPGKRRVRRAADNAGAPSGWPRLGASLSLFVSGGGHLLHRRWRSGSLYLLAFLAAAAFHYALGVSWAPIRDSAARFGLDEIDLLFGLLLVDAFVIALLLCGVYSAHSVGCARLGGRPETTPSPLGAGVASLLVPGWGQIVNGQVKKAMPFLGVVYAAVLGVAAWWSIPTALDRALSGLREPMEPLVFGFAFATLGIVTWTVSVYDAVLVALYRRRLASYRGRGRR